MKTLDWKWKKQKRCEICDQIIEADEELFDMLFDEHNAKCEERFWKEQEGSAQNYE